MAKRTTFGERLATLYRSEPNPRWQRDEGYFRPSPGGRRTCRLSPDATRFLIDNLTGRNSKDPTFIIIEPEGDIRVAGMQVFSDWVMAIKVALDEGAYVYNARNKKCCRPVWGEGVEERTLSNLTFEPVKLVADQKVYDAELPKVNTRLFALE